MRSELNWEINMIKKGLGALFFILLSSRLQAFVWQHDKEWNLEYERQYSAWIVDLEKSANRDEYKNLKGVPIFNTGKWKDIKADCTDVAYALRAIFAYEHKLPFVVANTFAFKGGVQISNTSAPASITSIRDQDERFRAFLNYVFQLVNNLNAAYDFYPVKISRAAIRGGGIFSKFGQHTYVIQKVTPGGVLQMISGTVPASDRDLYFEWDNPPIATKYYDKGPYGGIRMWRWPSDLKKNDQEMMELTPSYRAMSLEQYQIAEKYNSENPIGNTFDYKLEMRKKLALPGKLESFKEIMQRVWNDLYGRVKDRVKIVEEALNYKKSIKNRKMNSKEFYDYSTPERDEKIKWLFNEFFWAHNKYNLEEYAKGHDYQHPVNFLKNFSVKWQSEEAINENETTDDETLAPLSDEYINMWSLWERFRDDQVSSDPNDSREKRWGFIPKEDKEETEKAEGQELTLSTGGL